MNKEKKIIIATDHRGFVLKEYLKTKSIFCYETHTFFVEWVDVGAFTPERSDYPEFAHRALNAMHEKETDGAILLCGSGNGMAIAANRYTRIFACVAWSAQVAQQAKEDDNCNVLVIPADYVTQKEIMKIISFWLLAEFKGGRYAERLAFIDDLSQ
ncbi:MAG: RpiB/LacA/LacB family sugar-phosphate isomerase [Candidatus Babeliaceae bacterium]|nr:RpiB/LacA/LacB family sugar-phosphate isomerase [Candidatus Babeliaceae bacterium]